MATRARLDAPRQCTLPAKKDGERTILGLFILNRIYMLQTGTGILMNKARI